MTELLERSDSARLDSARLDEATTKRLRLASLYAGEEWLARTTAAALEARDVALYAFDRLGDAVLELHARAVADAVDKAFAACARIHVVPTRRALVTLAAGAWHEAIEDELDRRIAAVPLSECAPEPLPLGGDSELGDDSDSFDVELALPARSGDV